MLVSVLSFRVALWQLGVYVYGIIIIIIIDDMGRFSSLIGLINNFLDIWHCLFLLLFFKQLLFLIDFFWCEVNVVGQQGSRASFVRQPSTKSDRPSNGVVNLAEPIERPGKPSAASGFNLNYYYYKYTIIIIIIVFLS